LERVPVSEPVAVKTALGAAAWVLAVAAGSVISTLKHGIPETVT
jgi:hypothetical protein